MLFRLLVALRRWLFARRILHSEKLPVPVIVVGNITVGGTGKTPFVIWLVDVLVSRGLRPGVMSRGYRGRASTWPQRVTAQSDPLEVGDEPVLIAWHTGRPVVAAPQRVAAGRQLVDACDCDILVSDDGLQHYALQRDLEIAVIDGERGYGNGLMLPAGPLREPPSRLKNVDIVVMRAAGGGPADVPAIVVAATAIRNVKNPHLSRGLRLFVNQRVHGVAGIGYPQRFFDTLSELGMTVIPHRFADHYQFKPEDLAFADELPILMTEKDAVKCAAFAAHNMWYLEVAATPNQQLAECLANKLDVLAGVRKP